METPRRLPLLKSIISSPCQETAGWQCPTDILYTNQRRIFCEHVCALCRIETSVYNNTDRCVQYEPETYNLYKHMCKYKPPPYNLNSVNCVGDASCSTCCSKTHILCFHSTKILPRKYITAPPNFTKIDNLVSTEHVQLVNQKLQFVQFTSTIFAFNLKFLQWTSFFSIYQVC